VSRAHPVNGGCKYGDLALQVGGVSDETVKYGREFCGTWTGEWQQIVRENYRPVLSSERAPHKHTTVDVNNNKHLGMRIRWGSTPRHTD
jgi:hypothetical protein